VFPTATGVYSTAFILSHEKKLLIDGMLIDKDKQVLRSTVKDEELFFADYPYKEVFQVNMSELKEVTGLNFNWPKVKQIVVPEQKRRMEIIKSVENAKGAKAVAQMMRGPLGTIKMKTSRKDVTNKQLIKNNYLLTMILPD
jgi:hypothetical protein